MKAIQRALSRLSDRSSQVPEPSFLQGFLQAQRTAIACVKQVRGELRPGITEIETAALLDERSRKAGIRHYLHRPFAWFGERSSFSTCRSFKDFLPTERKLRADEVFILDLSPVVDGFVADVGYTASLSDDHAELVLAKDLLHRLRADIPRFFMEEAAPDGVWRRVDEVIAAAGYENCYRKYPFSVLGHRLYRMDAGRMKPFQIPLGSLSWFYGHSYLAFATRGVFPELLGPWHAGSKQGLWAIEPHIGTSAFGAKFEEILVVESNRAYWLDPVASL